MIEILISIARIIFGFAFTLFIPGFLLSLILFRNDGILKKLAFSCVFSIIITVSLAVFLDFVLGVDVTGISMSISLVVITVIFFSIWFLQPESHKKILKKILRIARTVRK